MAPDQRSLFPECEPEYEVTGLVDMHHRIIERTVRCSLHGTVASGTMEQHRAVRLWRDHLKAQ
jgi:hypothetical protein